MTPSPTQQDDNANLDLNSMIAQQDELDELLPSIRAGEQCYCSSILEKNMRCSNCLKLKARLQAHIQGERIAGFDDMLDALANVQNRFIIDPAAMSWLKNERHKYVAALTNPKDKDVI